MNMMLYISSLLLIYKKMCLFFMSDITTVIYSTTKVPILHVIPSLLYSKLDNKTCIHNFLLLYILGWCISFSWKLLVIWQSCINVKLLFNWIVFALCKFVQRLRKIFSKENGAHVETKRAFPTSFCLSSI